MLSTMTDVPWMTVLQAAERWAVDARTIGRWYDEGRLDGWRTGDPDQLDAHGRYGTRGARRIYGEMTPERFAVCAARLEELRDIERRHFEAAETQTPDAP